VFFMFGCISQGLHSPVDHLVHILSHHCGPFGLFCVRNLGYDKHNHLALHQLVDRKVVGNVRDAMFSMAASMLDSHVLTGELSILKPMTNQCPARATW
jgi:hypothetical protein